MERNQNEQHLVRPADETLSSVQASPDSHQMWMNELSIETKAKDFNSAKSADNTFGSDDRAKLNFELPVELQNQPPTHKSSSEENSNELLSPDVFAREIISKYQGGNEQLSDQLKKIAVMEKLNPGSGQNYLNAVNKQFALIGAPQQIVKNVYSTHGYMLVRHLS